MKLLSTESPLVCLIFRALALLLGIVAGFQILSSLAGGGEGVGEAAAAALGFWKGLGAGFFALCLWWMAEVVDLLGVIASRGDVSPPRAAAKAGKSAEQERKLKEARRKMGL